MKNRARMVALLSLAIALSGCAMGPPPVSDAEKQEAMTAAMDCLKAQIPQLDDGKSDAATVGYAAVDACLIQVNRSAELWAADLAPGYRGRFMEAGRADMLAMATQLVLRWRQTKAAH